MTKPPYFCCLTHSLRSSCRKKCKLRHRHQGLHLGLCSAERASKDVIQAAVAIFLRCFNGFPYERMGPLAKLVGL